MASLHFPIPWSQHLPQPLPLYTSTNTHTSCIKQYSKLSQPTPHTHHIHQHPHLPQSTTGTTSTEHQLTQCFMSRHSLYSLHKISYWYSHEMFWRKSSSVNGIIMGLWELQRQLPQVFWVAGLHWLCRKGSPFLCWSKDSHMTAGWLQGSGGIVIRGCGWNFQKIPHEVEIVKY